MIIYGSYMIAATGFRAPPPNGMVWLLWALQGHFCLDLQALHAFCYSISFAVRTDLRCNSLRSNLWRLCEIM